MNKGIADNINDIKEEVKHELKKSQVNIGKIIVIASSK